MNKQFNYKVKLKYIRLFNIVENKWNVIEMFNNEFKWKYENSKGNYKIIIWNNIKSWIKIYNDKGVE